MTPRSLRWRLLSGAAVAILAALAVAWIFMVVVFERHLERRLQSELERDGLRLAAVLAIGADGAPQIPTPPGDPRLHAPASGYYWQVSNAAGIVRSRSLWDSDLPEPRDIAADAWRLRRAAGPFEPSIVLLERRIEPDRDGEPVTIQLAQDTAPLASARDEFGQEMAIFLLFLWIVLAAAAWLQVRLGLMPLSRIGADVAALQRDPSARLADARLQEILPLTEAINTLAETRERDLKQARRRAADLAHGLKTPLSALRAHLRRARDGENAMADGGFDRAVDAIERAIEAELARVRVSVIRAAPSGQAKARAVVERLVDVLEHTDRGEQLVFSVDIADELVIPMSAEDLSELLGSVMDNAMRFARRQVRISGAEAAAGAHVLVEDDGPGIPEADRRDALKRGARLDEGGGAGLGLAIAKELAESAGGALELSEAALGGLAVRFSWPRRA